MTEEYSNYKLKPDENGDSFAIKSEESPVTAQPKYSVILRFWNTPQEIELLDIAFCQNRVTKQFFYKFLDVEGRLWENVPEQDVVIINNFPDKELVEDFKRLSREAKELEKQAYSAKKVNDDVSIQ